MALDRQSIEKKDFPVGHRGYDPEAVDAHLSTLADEVADLRRSARRRTDTLASSASEQVRSIVESAESSAAEIQRDAESEAREIRDEANSEAQATRQQATEQARKYVGKVSESTDTMLKRLDSMESELGSLIESLRTGSDRLSAALKLLEGNLTEVSGIVVPRPPFEREAPEPVAPEPAQEPAAQASAAPSTEPTPDTPSNGEAPAAEGGDDTEGARLIALNMALSGTPRAETERYLNENFSLSDASELLDEVYAGVDG